MFMSVEKDHTGFPEDEKLTTPHTEIHEATSELEPVSVADIPSLIEKDFPTAMWDAAMSGVRPAVIARGGDFKESSNS